MRINAPPADIVRVEGLVAEHRQLADEPLLLALYFEPDRDVGDIFVFEVIDGFGAGHVDRDQKLFEVSFGSTSSFPLEPGRQLRLVLTNPEEFVVACRDRWPSLEEVRQAIRNGRAVTIFADPARPDLEAALNG
jgi:hypothetical protein